MDKLTENVCEVLLEWGADLVGIAPVDRFKDAPKGHRPSDFLPKCKSVISIGVHIFEGMGDVWGEYDEFGKTITPYLFYGFGLTNLESSMIVNRMAKLLEYKGYETLCFMPTWPVSSYKYFEEGLVTGKIKAEFSHRHAAVAAGLGTLGWNGIMLSPEFGSMQRLNSILTSTELEPTPLYEGPSLCRPDECGKKCVHVCPADAFSEGEGQSFIMEGRTMTYSIHDNIRCCYALSALVKGSGGRSNLKIRDDAGMMDFMHDRQSQEVNLFDQSMLNMSPGVICGNFCGKCVHKCPSKKLAKQEMQDYDLTKRYSSLNRDLRI